MRSKNGTPGNVFQSIVAREVPYRCKFIEPGIVEAEDRQVGLIDEKCVGEGHELGSCGRKHFKDVGFAIHPETGQRRAVDPRHKFTREDRPQLFRGPGSAINLGGCAKHHQEYHSRSSQASRNVWVYRQVKFQM